jgi:hypothetical protein
MENESEIPKLQTARMRTCNHSELDPKLQTARKHTGSGFLFVKELNRSIKTIRKRRFQIDIYEIEVDRAEDEDPKVKSNLLFIKKPFFSFPQIQF